MWGENGEPCEVVVPVYKSGLFKKEFRLSDIMEAYHEQKNKNKHPQKVE